MHFKKNEKGLLPLWVTTQRSRTHLLPQAKEPGDHGVPRLIAVDLDVIPDRIGGEHAHNPPQLQQLAGHDLLCQAQPDSCCSVLTEVKNPGCQDDYIKHIKHWKNYINSLINKSCATLTQAPCSGSIAALLWVPERRVSRTLSVR